MSKIVERFWELCLEADEAFQGESDVRPFLSRVLQLVESAPEAHDDFVHCFAKLIQGRGPWEVVYFCMRHLRWPEVYSMATAALNESNDFRVKNIMAHIHDAYTERPEEDYIY